MLGQSISKNSVILGSFALITAGVLASTYFFTKDRIFAAEQRAANRALLEIIPREQHDNDMLNDVYPLSQKDKIALNLDPKNDVSIHIARASGKPVGVIIPSVAPDGYSGAIKLLIGINIDQRIAGVRVLSHKETPGLGDKIDLNKSNWILSFTHKSLVDPAPHNWGVKKDGGDFDQFTGATITPRAVVQQVMHTLEYFNAHHDIILNTMDVNPVLLDTTESTASESANALATHPKSSQERAR